MWEWGKREEKSRLSAAVLGTQEEEWVGFGSEDTECSCAFKDSRGFGSLEITRQL